VLLDDDSGERKKQSVVAYYTLAGGAVTRETLPTNQTLPSYPVPVTLLARLAVSKEYQGRGLGEKTLVTALRQAVLLSNKGLPSFGVVLDVLDEDALSFYQRFDMFHSFSDNPMRLFVPIRGIQYL
jgi:GNAT superfamily N-acetyltransferase